VRDSGVTTHQSATRKAFAVAALLVALANPPAGYAAQSAVESPSGLGTDATDVSVMIDARIVGDTRRTRFIADLSHSVEIGLFTLADPYRLVLDLPQVKFALPAGVGETGRGMISAFRYGKLSPGKSRIVLDLTGPVDIDKSFVVPPADSQPARLVIDVVPTTRETFLAANRRYRDEQSAEALERQNRSLIPRSGERRASLTVVIDPGHGGIDSGATGKTGALEKDITLEFAKLLGAKLEKTGRYDVHYTREDDRFVALSERIGIARSLEADLFVSIHANSFSMPSVRGTVIYTVSDEASDKMAAEIAASENESDILAGIDIDQTDSDGVMDILIDLTRRETRNFGVVFARNLVKELSSATKMFKIPHQQAGFKVLEAPDVPSAMVELGYLSNADDEKQLLSTGWREKAADSIVRAIADYFDTKVVQKAER
jgi:N-acetylmuramoyl-L-alanine amidase